MEPPPHTTNLFHYRLRQRESSRFPIQIIVLFQWTPNTRVQSCWFKACVCVLFVIQANPKTQISMWNSLSCSFQNSVTPSVTEMKQGERAENSSAKALTQTF